MALLALASACAPTTPQPPASIVLVTIDTLRADRLGCYGYFRDTSPHIDRFAEEAVLFESAVTPMATTLPAHVSVMTSSHPLRHGVQENYAHFHPPEAGDELQTFAQMVSRAGYRTAGFVSAAVLRAESGIAAGFEHYDEPSGVMRKATATTDAVLAWLEEPPTEPFFLWIHYWDPHLPYSPPPEYGAMFDESEPAFLEYLEQNGFADQDTFHQVWGNRFPDLRVTEINNSYDAEIRYTDAELGRVLDRLEELGLDQTAAIAILSDHGEGLGQHNWIDHGEIYNEQIKVPLILRFPKDLRRERNLEGTRIRSVVSTVDLIPMLAQQLNLPLSERDLRQFEGGDRLGESNSRNFAFSERVHRNREWIPGKKYALTGDEWKYHHFADWPDQLYHVATDPWESNDVMERNPDQAEDFKSRLDRILRARGAQGPALRKLGDLSEETSADLEALGYTK